jgi:hypothetical protein
MKSTKVQSMQDIARWHGRPERGARGLIGAVALASLAALLPRFAAADTVLTYDLAAGSVLAGGGTLPPSAFCAETSNCPSAPAFALSASEPLTGTVSFDVTNDTMTFDLTLTQNATFGSLTVASGSTFVATAANPVSVQVLKSGSGAGASYSFSPATTPSTVAANLSLSSGFTETAGQPTIPGIECTASQTGGNCSLLIGTGIASSGALQIAQGGTAYNGVMSISANLTPVPLPSSVILMLGGLGVCLLAVRGRMVPARRVIRARKIV